MKAIDVLKESGDEGSFYYYIEMDNAQKEYNKITV